MASLPPQRGGRGGGRGGRGGRGNGKPNNNRSGGRQDSPKIELPVLPDCTYIDTHVHLEYILEKVARKGGIQGSGESEATPMERILKSFPAHANFEGCIAVFCDATALSPSLAIWPEFILDDRIWAAFGLHPHTSQYYNDALEQRIKDALTHEKAVAWGECGLDFAKMHSPKETQLDAFRRQIKAAVSIGKPIMVHSRKAAQETFDLLAENAPANYPIHIHCFSDTVVDAERYLKHFSRLVRHEIKINHIVLLLVGD